MPRFKKKPYPHNRSTTTRTGCWRCYRCFSDYIADVCTFFRHLPLPEPVAGDAIAAFQTTSLTCAPSSANTSTALSSFPQPPTLSAVGSSAASPSNIITPSLFVSTSTITKALPSTSTSTQSEFASILKQLSPLSSCDEKRLKSGNRNINNASKTHVNSKEKWSAGKTHCQEIKRKIEFGQVESSAKSKNKVDKTKTKHQSNANVPPSTSKDAGATCIVCGESFKENWIQCKICRDWSHELCAGIDDSLYYYCDDWVCGSKSLKGMRLNVPRAVRVGHSVTLECDYDLETAPLYSVKWYRGPDEFYRYVPKEEPPTAQRRTAHQGLSFARTPCRPTSDRIAAKRSFVRERSGIRNGTVTSQSSEPENNPDAMLRFFSNNERGSNCEP
ncbi:hypothetical protein QE152_g1857 [Popillia japonica]|uniref:Uncharacterized protein n=1 Tax=Popillia japonica TaxID=7064 RepID=A0AAW1N835_POPJA